MAERKFPIYSQTCGLNPTKGLKINDDGSIGVILGRFGVPSSDGLILEWPTEEAEIEAVMKRLQSGTLRGEYRPGSTLIGAEGLKDLEMKKRQIVIREENVSHVIKSVVRKDIGDGVSVALGTIIPTGPQKDMIYKEFEKDNGRICFGLRCFAEIHGNKKIACEFITFDLVSAQP